MSSLELLSVRDVGVVLAHPIVLECENVPEPILQAFRIANAWRGAHEPLMRSLRQSVIQCLMREEMDGVTAARLKRMAAIRRKLMRDRKGLESFKLDEIQDIAGCRVIVSTVDQARRLGSTFRGHDRFPLEREDDYIARPKRTGYRSHHLIFHWPGAGPAGETLHIELQVRTWLQHSWATAVEAVGLARREYLKGGRGDQDWLRFFELMSAEFAHAEGTPVRKSLPDRKERLAEIRALNNKLGVEQTLDQFSRAVQWTQTAVRGIELPDFYLIEYDVRERSVRVTPKSGKRETLEALYAAERNAAPADDRAGYEFKDFVLVEADKIESLKQAYPNYFGDVQLFQKQLGRIVRGKDLVDFTIIPQPTVRRPKEPIFTQWYRRYRRWK